MAHTYVSPNAKIRKVIEVSSSTNQDIFPVVDEGNRYRGFIRATDLTHYGEDENLTVNEVLQDCEESETRNIYIYLDSDLTQAKRVLTTNKISFVPVVDYDGHYMGTLDEAST
jgi:CBS domain-containing protein